ncbi:MAG TPA: hypothetical protein VI168_07755 [Croceibacterium sp.]
MINTDAIGADATAAPAVHPEAGEPGSSPGGRCIYRARFWRLALGALGLFWVAAFLLLTR